VYSEARGLGLPEAGYMVVETSACAAGRHRALAMTADGGTCVLLEGGEDPPGPGVRAFAAELCEREATIVCAGPCHPDLLPELCARVVRGQLDLAPLVCAIAPTEAGAALAARRRGAPAALPVVVFFRR
jgi:hypothetical protein